MTETVSDIAAPDAPNGIKTGDDHPLPDGVRRDALRMPTVYPGHPCLIAMQVMAAFPNYDAAAALTVHGWRAALSCSHVRGAGGAVNQGMEILRLMHDESMSEEDAFAFGCMLWDRSRQSDHPDALDEGRTAAEKQSDRFVSMARVWIASSLAAQSLQDASGSTISHPA